MRKLKLQRFLPILAVAAVVLIVASPALARAVEIDLAPCAAGVEITEPIELALLPLGQGVSPDAEPRSRSVTLAEETTAFHLPLEPGSWRLVLSSPEFWAQPVTVERGVGELRVPIWPRSTLTGTVRVPRGETVSPYWQVRLETGDRGSADRYPPQPGECRLPEAVATCGITDEGELLCALPAGRWNVTLKTSGWAAHHLWSRELPPARPVRLGEVALRRGARP